MNGTVERDLKLDVPDGEQVAPDAELRTVPIVREFRDCEGDDLAEVVIPELDARSHTIEVFCAALGRSVIQLVRYDARIRLSDDPEAVHQARVAVRRMRSDLRTFLPALERDWGVRVARTAGLVAGNALAGSRCGRSA